MRLKELVYVLLCLELMLHEFYELCILCGLRKTGYVDILICIMCLSLFFKIP